MVLSELVEKDIETFWLAASKARLINTRTPC